MGHSWELLWRSFPFLLQGVVVTLKISFLGLLVGFIGGSLVGIANSRHGLQPGWQRLIQAAVWFLRGTPLFVQVLIVYYALPQWIGIPLSPFVAGVIALGLNSTAYIGEIIRGGMNALPEGQWEAAAVLGLGRWQTLKGIILPQTLQLSLPALTNELTTLIKETSILMVIGVAELTKVSKDIVARELDPMTIYLAAAALYFLLTSLFSFAAYQLQKKVSA